MWIINFRKNGRLLKTYDSYQILVFLKLVTFLISWTEWRGHLIADWYICQIVLPKTSTFLFIMRIRLLIGRGPKMILQCVHCSLCYLFAPLFPQGKYCDHRKRHSRPSVLNTERCFAAQLPVKLLCGLKAPHTCKLHKHLLNGPFSRFQAANLVRRVETSSC